MIHCNLKREYLVALLFCLGANFALHGQEDCSTVLSKAQKQYDAGVIEQIPKMLQPCIESGFTREEKTQAYKLIIMSYLFDNNTKMSESAMLDFLKKYPEYEIQPADQAEFIQLFNTYRTLPISSVGIIMGTNSSNIVTSSWFNDPKTERNYSSSGFSYQLGFSFRRYLLNKFDINIEAFYVQSSYQLSYVDTVASGFTVGYSETQSRIEVPLTLIYTPYAFGKFTTFARGGVNFGYLMNAKATYTGQPENSKPYTDPESSILDRRTRFQIMAVLGAGICYKIKHSDIFLEMRYNLGLKNQVNTRYDLNDLSSQTKYFYTDNAFKINYLCFSVGFNYKFYKPEKRNR
jgi:hypothetical protein